MTPTRFAFNLMTVATVLALSLAFAQSPANRVDSVFEKFWSSKSPAEAAKTISDVIKTGITFDDAVRRLKAGRKYTAQKPGVVKLSNTTSDGIEHYFSVNVPQGYDPSKRYQVRFQLHGGVGARGNNEPRGTGEIGALAGAEQFYVLPYSWNTAPWWSDDQILNMDSITDTLKRMYNIDENRVVVSGVSDGGTGAYYIAMREVTPFASFLPLNGFIMVLANDRIDDGEMFPNNLRNKPMFVINGGKDRLYPTANVEPFVKHLMAKGVDIEYHPQPDGEHNTAWWPQMKEPFEKFVAEHARDPHPDKLTWETGNMLHNRAHWLVISELGAQSGDSKQMADINEVKDSDPLSRVGRVGLSLFVRINSPGRVDLVRTGNTVQATTRGVSAFTLLLSPDKFDFRQPVKVIANGRIVFEGRVTPSVETLMKWAARDNDRTMLYGAELKIQLGS